MPITRNSGSCTMRNATPKAASTPSPYCTARLFSSSAVTIRNELISSSETPTPKTSLTIGRRTLNHFGDRLIVLTLRVRRNHR